MGNHFSRLLLGFASLILLAGGVMHTRAFPKTVSAAAASNLPVFYASSLKALWLIDSATLITLSLIFALIAARPTVATRPVVVLLAVVPAATSFLLYKFLGSFLPAHMLLAAAAAALVGGLGLRRD